MLSPAILNESTWSDTNSQIRILIVADNASLQMGGESSLPYSYFKLFRERGIETWMICHARVREELRRAFPDDFHRITFVEDTWLQTVIWKASLLLPYRIRQAILEQVIHLVTQINIRPRAKQLIRQHQIDLVFEPAPVPPKGISLMYDLGAPVVMGPLSGGITFPPAFRYMDSLFTHLSIHWGRVLSQWVHQVLPGKLRADALIVANNLTDASLPKGCQGRIYKLVEIGVDPTVWQVKTHQTTPSEKPVRFAYLGRFADWKGVQFLIEAFQKVAAETDAVLDLIGDGDLFEEIKSQVTASGLSDRIILHGWLSAEESSKRLQQCDVFVMPSLRECGGIAVLEAMASGLPVIVTQWGGPGEYVDPACGILVEPNSRETFVEGLTAAMLRLAQDAELRDRMGRAGRQYICGSDFEWNTKVGRLLEIFQETIAQSVQ